MIRDQGEEKKKTNSTGIKGKMEDEKVQKLRRLKDVENNELLNIF